MANDEDGVGYKRPPKSGQFKPGKSGNPRGRPKGGSVNRDFMILEFQGGDRLFVPADRLDLVQKYSGVAGHKPILDKLGGTGWDKVKSRVKASVASMAKELLELYARRRAATGHAFGPDTPWQAELEAAFPFELTADQERAVRDVKDDIALIRSLRDAAPLIISVVF